MPSFLSTHDTFFLSYLPPLLFTLKKQRREVSINRPASYEPAALPLRHPAIHTIHTLYLLILIPFLILFHLSTKNSIAGNRTRGANVRGLHVTNYTTMDYITISTYFQLRCALSFYLYMSVYLYYIFIIVLSYCIYINLLIINKKRIRPTGFEPVT